MKAIGVDLGGTKLNIGVVDDEGNFEIEERSLTLSNWPEMRETIVNACKALIEKNKDIKLIKAKTILSILLINIFNKNIYFIFTIKRYSKYY